VYVKEDASSLVRCTCTFKPYVKCPSLVGLQDLQAINVHINGQFVTERLVQDKPNQINSTIMFIKTLGPKLDAGNKQINGPEEGKA